MNGLPPCPGNHVLVWLWLTGLTAYEARLCSCLPRQKDGHRDLLLVSGNPGEPLFSLGALRPCEVGGAPGDEIAALKSRARLWPGCSLAALGHPKENTNYSE